MLDIQIFHTDRPIYDNGKKVGLEPHLSLGTYTTLTSEENNILNQMAKEPDSITLATFYQILHSVGKRFYIANLMIELSKATHPKAKEHLRALLHQLSPYEQQKLTQVQMIK